MYEIRDPIHKTIAFSNREKGIVDHPFVQRLRYVRQLGFSYLVYPGSTHDRFSHAIGAMHVAGLVWTRILETSRDQLAKYFSADDIAYFGRILRLAGLLHDVGHPPFSHVSEKFMPKVKALGLPPLWMPSLDPERRAAHEDYSIALIAALCGESGAAIAAVEAQDIASLIHHGVIPSAEWQRRFGDKEGGTGGIHRLLQSLISGELDCDRMDYLLRDAYFTGVAYGTHDIDHIVSNLGLTEQPGVGLTLTIDSTAVRAFEDFLLSRYHMFLQVYMHKTTSGFDLCLAQALAAGEFTLDVPGKAEDYADLRDSTLLERAFAAARQPANRWSQRLTRRIPLKMLFSSQNAKEEDRAIMNKLADALSTNGITFFQVHSHQYLSRLLSRPAGGSSASALLARRKLFGKFVYEPIESYSSLLNKYNEIIDLTYLYVVPEDAAKALAVVEQL